MYRLISRRTMFAGAGKYIRFADKEVERICIANWSSDGKGLTYEDAAAVTNIGKTFKNNTNIVAFDELKYFTGLTRLEEAFWGCSALERVTIPSNILSDFYASFRDTNLTDITFLGAAFATHYSTFMQTHRPLNVHLFSSDYSVIAAFFNGNINQDPVRIYVDGALVTDFVIPDGVTALSSSVYALFDYGITVHIPSSVTTIDGDALYARNAVLVFGGTTPPTISHINAVGDYNTEKYVPYSADHSVLNAYKSADKWSDIESTIYELNPDGSIPQN